MSLYELQPILTTREVGWVLGMTLGAISYGALLALSISCIGLLHRTAKPFAAGGFWNQHRVFQGYVVLILALNTILQVDHIKSFIQIIFYTKPDQVALLYRGPWRTLNGWIVVLADGLLVSVLYRISHTAERLHILYRI